MIIASIDRPPCLTFNTLKELKFRNWKPGLWGWIDEHSWAVWMTIFPTLKEQLRSATPLGVGSHQPWSPSQTLAPFGWQASQQNFQDFVTLLETHNNKFIYPMKVSDDYSTQLSFFWWEFFGRFFQGLNCLLGVRERCENGSQHFAAQQDVSPC